MASFYFKLDKKDVLKRSFESFFSEEFRYQETNLVRGIEKDETCQDIIDSLGDNWIIVTDEPKKNEPVTDGLVNISVDAKAFKSWLLSDPYGDGELNVADLIKIIKPTTMEEELATYYYFKFVPKFKFLNGKMKSALNQLTAVTKKENE